MPEPNASTAGAEPANQPPPCLRFPLPMSQEVLEAFPFPLLISTCDGLAIGANDLVGQLFRISKDVLIGRFNLLTDPLPHANSVRDLFHAAVAGQRVQAPRLSYDFSFPGTETAGPPGCWVETTFLPFRDATGRVTHVGALIQDVTARVDFEREATMFQTLVEHASDGIAVTTLDGRVTPGVHPHRVAQPERRRYRSRAADARLGGDLEPAQAAGHSDA